MGPLARYASPKENSGAKTIGFGVVANLGRAHASVLVTAGGGRRWLIHRREAQRASMSQMKHKDEGRATRTQRSKSQHPASYEFCSVESVNQAQVKFGFG